MTPQVYLFFFAAAPFVLVTNMARIIGDGFNRNWLRPIQPSEIDTLSVDFTDELAAGETLTATEWTIAVSETATGFAADTTPGLRLHFAPGLATASDPFIGTRSFSNQSVSAMLAGNCYLLNAEVNTSFGRVLAKSGLIWCRPPLGGA